MIVVFEFFTYALQSRLICSCYFQFAGHSALYGMNRSLKSGGIFPSTFNVAAKADIFVNATCGEEGPETFCKPSESSRCGVCDARSPDPGKRHNISNILDSSPGKWWQSPTLARGDRYEYVTIVLDLKQVRRTKRSVRFSNQISPFSPSFHRKKPVRKMSADREKTAFYSKRSNDLSTPLSLFQLETRAAFTLKGRLVGVSATGPFPSLPKKS